VLTAYFFLDRWGMSPDVTMQQDEAILYDLMDMDRQINYKKWAQSHGLDDVDDPSVNDVFVKRTAPSYQKMFGGVH
jgi:hypothetical protein